MNDEIMVVALNFLAVNGLFRLLVELVNHFAVLLGGKVRVVARQSGFPFIL